MTMLFKGIKYILTVIQEQVDQEFFNEEHLEEKLLELEFAYELGEISEDDYLTNRQIIVDRLRMVKEMKLEEEIEEEIEEEEEG